MQATEPLQNPGALLRLDRASGTLKERRYQVAIIGGPGTGLTRAIEGSMTVGSHPDAGLSLSDTTVSRYHVELTARPDGVRVRDLESTNGTWLGGARITEVIVEDQATLSVGKTTLKVSMLEADLGTPEAQPTFGPALGASPAMKQLFGMLEKVAPSDSTVLLLGETGTGKEVMARAIHQKSPRATRPFVVVDCGSVAPTLIESELFGHVRGAFTGAVSDHPGLFLLADGGTVFLDEIENTTPALQAKLLRVLETGEVRAVGGTQTRRVDIRLITASNRDLALAVKADTFRADLFFRLNTFTIEVPPLRERPDDLVALARYFVDYFNHQHRKGVMGLSLHTERALLRGEWPGNVRELRNVVERAVLLCPTGTLIEPEHLHPSYRAASTRPDVPLQSKLEDVERETLRDALARNSGIVRRAAIELGMNPVTFARRARKLKLAIDGK